MPKVLFSTNIMGDAMGDKAQDTRQVSDLGLARWILSVLSAQQDAANDGGSQ